MGVEVASRAVVVTLDEGDAAALARQLARAIRLGWVTRGQPPPRLLLDFAESLNRAARSSASGTQTRTSDLAAEPGNPQASTPLPRWEQPETLTVRDAAAAVGVSTSYLRRLIRKGAIDVMAPGHHQSAYAVYTDSLTAWASRRRRSHERKAA